MSMIIIARLMNVVFFFISCCAYSIEYKCKVNDDDQENNRTFNDFHSK